jgi:hypothetical protein
MCRRFVMKKSIILGLLIALIPTTAHAEEKGAWVQVDSNGNVISQAIVCTPSVCGGTNFMGGGWILQNPVMPDGNVTGVGAKQGTSVKLDLETKVWTITSEIKIIDPISEEVIGVRITEQKYNGTLQNPITKEANTTVTTQRFTSDYAPWVSNNAVSKVATVVIPSITSNFIAQQELEIAALKEKTAKLLKKIKKKARK